MATLSGIITPTNVETASSTSTLTNKTINGSNNTITNIPLSTGVTGTLPIANGGTGSTSTTFANLATNVTGTLPVANGGTGLTALGTASQVLRVNSGATALEYVALPSGAGDSAIVVHSGNGFGSVNTKIRRYTTTKLSTGSDITYADSAANGGTFTINTTGIYSITVADVFSSGPTEIGASVNSNQLTTDLSSITAADRLMFIITPGANQRGSLSAAVYLTATSIVRSHTAGDLTGSSENSSFFMIRRVG